MLETLGFFHISSKNPVDADIANRKHYSAPAGALTFLFMVKRFGTDRHPGFEPAFMYVYMFNYVYMYLSSQQSIIYLFVIVCAFTYVGVGIYIYDIDDMVE